MQRRGSAAQLEKRAENAAAQGGAYIAAQAFAEATCEAHFGDEVDFVVGTGPDGVTKPDAKRLLARIAEVGATKCMYCGDSEVDIMTAANADMPCVSVTWGYRTREELVASGATMVADTAEQVYDFAQKFFA